MGLLNNVAAALALGQSVASVAVVERRQDAATAKWCDTTQKTVCYSEFAPGNSGVVYRIALPDVSRAPFDTLVSVVAPNAVGWAGMAWGGSMSQNPLTLVWMNGNQGMASSRWASGHTPPAGYDGAVHSVLNSVANATHWQVDVLCSGCSTWETSNLDPNTANKIGFAISSTAPGNPSNNASTISVHTEKGLVTPDLSLGKVDSNSFRRFVLYLSSKSPQSSAANNPPAAEPTQATQRSTASTGGRIPTTIIRGTQPAQPQPQPTDEGEEQPQPTTSSRVTSSVQSYPPTTIGRSTTPVRTSVTTVPRASSTTSRGGGGVTVTVTVTQGQGATTTRAPVTSVRQCTSRVGRTYRIVPCSATATPSITWGDDGDQDQDQDQDSGSWSWGGSGGGGGWGGRGGRGGRRDLAADDIL